MTDEDFHSETEGEFFVDESPKSLTKDEAANCLNCVGPSFRNIGTTYSYSSCSYAYVALDAVRRNLTDVDILPYFTHIMFLDLSSNRLTDDSLNALVEMKQLITLIVDNNRLETAVVPMFPQLQILSLKNNRIKTCRVNSQPNLGYLELEGNNIQEIKPGFWGSKKLPNLKELGLRNNGLTSSAGINFPNLVSLFLADNEITVLKGLEKLTNLKFLHLRNNPLKSLEGFSGANRKLFYINLRSCKISNVKELKKLSVLPRLERIVVLENPFTETEYRIQMIAMLPRLQKIDKTLVQKSEKRNAEQLAKRMSESDEEEDIQEGEEMD